MAKIDLKDAYLTVPVATQLHCLLAFPNESKGFLQFQTLPFGLLTPPCEFSKITKSAVQFLQDLSYI